MSCTDSIVYITNTLQCVCVCDCVGRLAKAAAQEEAGKHAYATYLATEAIAKQFLTQTYVTSLCPCTSPTEDHALVYWSDEDSVSLIPLSSIANTPAVVGEGCQVRIGRTFKTMNIGMRALLLLLLLLLL